VGGRSPAVPLGTMIDELDGGIKSRSQVAKEARRVWVGRTSGRRKWKLRVVRDILNPRMLSFCCRKDQRTARGLERRRCGKVKRTSVVMALL
jgi:hypothetical protein